MEKSESVSWRIIYPNVFNFIKKTNETNGKLVKQQEILTFSAGHCEKLALKSQNGHTLRTVEPSRTTATLFATYFQGISAQPPFTPDKSAVFECTGERHEQKLINTMPRRAACAHTTNI